MRSCLVLWRQVRDVRFVLGKKAGWASRFLEQYRRGNISLSYIIETEGKVLHFWGGVQILMGWCG
jgi:hypothetical protein